MTEKPAQIGGPGGKNLIKRSNLECQPFKGKPTYSIFALSVQPNRVQEVEERGGHPQLSIMYGSDKGDIPLTNVVRHHHMVCHRGLVKMDNTIYNQESFLQGLISTPDIIPEPNLKPISHLISHKSK
jgi:hypothetical protein